MKHKKILLLVILASMFALSCVDSNSKENHEEQLEETTFNYNVEQFADTRIIRYQIPGWDNLSLQQQKLVYYLTQAGLSGRDIIWDQNYRHNLKIRHALESVYSNFKGDRTTEDWKSFELYLKRIWFSNGIHHFYSNDKMIPEFSADYLKHLLDETNTTLEDEAFDVIFNETDSKKVNLANGIDNVLNSAVNFYSPDITNREVEAFYSKKKSPNPEKPLSFGLNSKLVKENGVLKEQTYKSGGLYGTAIDEIIKWLELAKSVAENDAQANALGLLIEYYKTGDLQTWDDYNIAWTAANDGDIDYINSFIEVYNDPLGYRGSYETYVEIKDFEMSKKMEVLSENAQWFEDHSPIMDEHKKKNVQGVSYKTVNIAGLAGDAYPHSSIGVNLPNANWIRATVGSKSVSLGNIIDAYDNSAKSGRLKEFVNDEEELQREEKYGKIADKLHTALHEVVGHASGKINPGVGEVNETLKNYRSTLEEGRADLVALYYIYDPKIQELGLVDNWEEVGKAQYDGYIRNGLLTQLIRLKLGDDVEESHMRNRQWVSAWVYEKGKPDNVIEKITRDGKTYYNINDYAKLHDLFGELLREAQRIKSEGDYKAVETLVETYGVKVDQAIHVEILERNKQFTTAPYGGFVNPELVPETNDSGEITAIKVVQPETYAGQMLEYSKNYGFLPEMN